MIIVIILRAMVEKSDIGRRAYNIIIYNRQGKPL